MTYATAETLSRELGYTSFADLMKKNERIVCAEVRKLAPSPAEFDDMLQEVWSKVAQRLGQFAAKNGAKLSTWLHPVARNTSLSYLEKMNNSRLKGSLMFEHEVSIAGDDDVRDVEHMGSSLAFAPSPETLLEAKQTAERIVTGSIKTAKSRREAGVAAMLDLYGFEVLAELMAADKEELADSSAEFLAEVLLMDTEFSSEEAHVAAWDGLTEALGGTGAQACFTAENLVALARQYGFEPELSISQIAALLDRTVENIRVHNSRGSEDVLRFAAPEYYAEVQQHRASRRKAREVACA